MNLLRGAKVDDLAAIDGVGSIIAQSICDFFATEDNLKVVERLAAAGVTMEEGASRKHVAPNPRGPNVCAYW